VCRFLAYVGPETSLASLLLQPPHSLLRQSYEPRFQRRGRVNADGFGIGWYDPAVRPEPALYRRATPIWSDRSLESMAGVIRTGAVVASVRDATPPSPVQEANTGPFADGPWLFAHNGEVTGYATGGRARLLGEVSEHRAAGMVGTADSELVFALVLDRLDAGAAPAEALEQAVATVLATTGGRLTMVVCDGARLAATACGDSLYVHEGKGLVVASEPYDDDAGWREVPDGWVLEGSAGEAGRMREMAR